jgi:hypothetical protein
MADPVSRARAELHQAREVRQERAAEFWQRVILEGRQQRQARGEMRSGETPAQKPRGPRKRPS